MPSKKQPQVSISTTGKVKGEIHMPKLEFAVLPSMLRKYKFIYK